VRHVVNSIVRVNTFQVPTAPLRLLHMAAIQARISRRDRVAVAVSPSLHEVRDIRQAAIPSLAPVIRDRIIFPAVEFKNRHILAAGVAVDDDGVGVTVSIGRTLVVSARHSGESGDAS
jgi:hypothetical protein